jgi:undecaprenyl-diphosphatase
MNIIEALILGAVQGLTEFLPISSSGHLVLIPYIFNWKYGGLDFDIALHAGTAIALLAFFWRDWLNIIKNAFIKAPVLNVADGGAAGDGLEKYPKNFLWQILVASIPAVIVGLTIDKYVENIFHSVLLIAFNLAFFGWLLWFIDKKAKADLKPGAITFRKAFIVGLFQAIALIPGVSRSGITITASRLIGLERGAAARFSFLLATPAIVGAFLLKVPDILQSNIGLSFWLGVAAATIFGLAAIKLLLVYLKKSDFSLFLWYRLAVAAIVVVVFFVRF